MRVLCVCATTPGRKAQPAQLVRSFGPGTCPSSTFTSTLRRLATHPPYQRAHAHTPHPHTPLSPSPTMPYEEVEIEDMEWSDELQAYTYACPCGDVFQITKVRERRRVRAFACLPPSKPPVPCYARPRSVGRGWVACLPRGERAGVGIVWAGVDASARDTGTHTRARSFPPRALDIAWSGALPCPYCPRLRRACRAGPACHSGAARVRAHAPRPPPRWRAVVLPCCHACW